MSHELPKVLNAEGVAEIKSTNQLEEAVITAPSSEEYRRRLHDFGLMTIHPALTGLLGGFAQEISRREATGQDLVTAWDIQMSKIETLPNTRSVLDSMFYRALDHLDEKSQAVRDARIIKNLLLANIASREKEVDPSLEELGEEDELENFERYQQARRIGDIIHYYIDQAHGDDIRMDDRRENEPNPIYDQTHRGFYLEFYYGMPSTLWTPWGKKDIGGSGSGHFEKVSFKILDALGAKIEIPGMQHKWGYEGPIYSLHSVDGEEMPDPVLRPKSLYRDYKLVKDAWLSLTNQNYEERNEKAPLTVRERFALDEVILEERGKRFPPPNEFDITSLEGLVQFTGKIVKYTRNNGRTWEYGRVGYASDFSNGRFGFQYDREVLPHTQVHTSLSFTDFEFENGLVVRAAEPEEYEGLTFSYDNINHRFDDDNDE